jgi:hypothetical protein
MIFRVISPAWCAGSAAEPETIFPFWTLISKTSWRADGSGIGDDSSSGTAETAGNGDLKPPGCDLNPSHNAPETAMPAKQNATTLLVSDF